MKHFTLVKSFHNTFDIIKLPTLCLFPYAILTINQCRTSKYVWQNFIFENCWGAFTLYHAKSITTTLSTKSWRNAAGRTFRRNELHVLKPWRVKLCRLQLSGSSCRPSFVIHSYSACFSSTEGWRRRWKIVGCLHSSTPPHFPHTPHTLI